MYLSNYKFYIVVKCGVCHHQYIASDRIKDFNGSLKIVNKNISAYIQISELVGTPWTLTSASLNFGAHGAQAASESNALVTRK